MSSEPHKFPMPQKGDLRYHWVVARLDALEEDEMQELVLDAWRMVVPKRVAAEYDRSATGREPLATPRTRTRPGPT